VRAWREGRREASESLHSPDSRPLRAADRTLDLDSSTLGDIQAAGIDLDPGGPRPDHDPNELHTHPHVRSLPGEPPIIGIVGGGAVGSALAVALTRAGWPIAAIASRDPERRARLSKLVGGTRAFAEANALLDEVELIIVAVPDDAIAPLAGSLRMYSGQAMVHTSGLLGSEVLAPAMAAGTQIGSFHPLVAFADTERAVEALRGATVAVEGDEQLMDLLARMAEAVGAIPVRLAAGTKPAYHAAAVLAAGGFVALLDAIARLASVAGLDEQGALAVYGRLIEQTLGNARAIGIGPALTGPMTRGDTGTVSAHLAELRSREPGVLELYVAAARRELDLVEERRGLTPEAIAALRDLLAKPP